MRRLNLNHRLPLAFALAALLCGASLRATAQTTTTPLTPAQKAAAAAQAQAAAKAKAQAAQAQAQAQAQAAAAAKAKAAAGSQAAPATTAATARPNTIFTQGQPAATNTAATASAPTTAAPAAAAKPACGGFFNPCSPSSNSGGASGGGSSASPADSANRTSGGTGFAAGQGRFDYYDHYVIAYGCLRSGTRVFCDFDQFKQSPAQVNAQSAFSGTKLVMSGGRIFGVSHSTFVDTDGSTYPTAQMSPTTGVRLMLEYDDVPDTQNVAILSFNNKEIQNVAITPMNLQANGNPAPRSAPSGQQASSAPAAGQTGAAAPAQSKSDQAQAAVTNAQNQKSKWGSVLSQAKSTIGH